MHLRDAGVAHPVERHLAKVEVASSSLVPRSIKRLALQVVFFMNNDLEDPYAYPFQHPGPGCGRGHHARAAHRQPVPEEVCVSNAPFPQGKGVFSLWRQDAQAATNCLHADGACHTGFNGSSYLVIARRRPQGRRRGPQGSAACGGISDRGGWAGTWFCTSKAQGKTLVPTRKSQGSQFLSALPRDCHVGFASSQ